MEQTLLWLAVMVVSLVVLVKSADYFTSYSEKLGLAFGLSSFIIGATIIAIGTSLPELVSSMFAVIEGENQFVVDNIVGSNIANALLIFGIGPIIARTMTVKTSLIDVDLPFFFISMALFVFFASDRAISVGEGVFLLIFFAIFVIYSTKSDSSAEEIEEDQDELEELEKQFPQDAEPSGKKAAKPPVMTYLLYICIAGVGVAASAKFLIDSVLNVSASLGISSSMLTIVVVAIGTSLPEVLASLSAIRIGNHALAIGNVFGSNTFNLLLVGGLPSLFGPLPIVDTTYLVAIPFLVLVTFAAIFVTLDNKIRVWEGVAMLFLYVVFLGKITEVI
jgi:cation:H+ antiporter